MPRFAVTTFGCQMNMHDSERLAEVLRSSGELSVAQHDADVVVLNTCSVREKAEQKLRSEVGRWARVKQRERPELILVVAGCMAQQEGERILKTMPAVDVVIGPDNIAELPELLARVRAGEPPLVRTHFDLDEPRFLSAPSRSGGPTAFVTTMKGCDERCSFCVVPYTRGPERYRPSDDIVAEIAELVSRGVREVTLLGQTVNSYRDPLCALAPAPEASAGHPDESEFAALLRRVAAEVPHLARLRYTSPHPRHLTPSLVAAHRDLPVLPRHVHLPVQSGSDRVLRRMIRRHTRAEYVERVERLRREVPGITLSTDIIVGFPGETEDDFARTLSLVDEVGFSGVFGFMYSPRPNTPALRLGDDVPPETKAARLQRLFELTERRIGEHLQSLVGDTLQVLVEGPSKARGDMLTGRSEQNEIVHLGASAGLVGRIVEVEIVEAYKHSLRGVVVGEPARRAPARRALHVIG